MRNIVASPLSGRVGGSADVREWVRRLDAAICAEPDLAALPGRFWFSIDDGRGDVSGLAADAGVHVTGDSVALLLAGRDTGVRFAAGGRRADAGLDRAALPRDPGRRVARSGTRGPLCADRRACRGPPSPGATWPPVTRPPVGWIEPGRRPRSRSVRGAPLGVLQARVAEYLAAIDAPMVITPWRSVLVCDLDEGVADAALRVLAPMGLVFDESSPWLDVSACTGSPGCEHSAADVRADATRAVGDPQHGVTGTSSAANGPAAARRRPRSLIATGDGYGLRTASPVG